MSQDRNFHKSWQKDGGKVGENPTALRAAVFLLSAKNRRGVFKHPPPPPSRAKVNVDLRVFPFFPILHWELGSAEYFIDVLQV